MTSERTSEAPGEATAEATPHAGSRWALRLHDVHKRYGQRDVLSGVSFELAPGARLGVIGPAASGKTVIAKLVAGLEVPDRGVIEVLGHDLAGKRESELGALRQRIGMLFQNHALFDFLSVEQNVAFPLEQRGRMAAPEIATRVAERLRAVGLAGSEHKVIEELSGGMKKRVGIARATVADAELVIYDEPTAGLDPVTTQKIYDLLAADQARTGATVLAISSDVTALASFVDEIAFLYHGQIFYRGPARTIADAPEPVVRQFVRGELEGPLDEGTRRR
ncbi:MAG TPA: ATP-binding cassette domain-containing protein [Kofleriaceae bacterium]|jgi:phospholipid/cholesterol/gamma-HCH transport system ATP-binding protein|nr:ATP-binding cassette domain-containing protein [Kofleriaceae bacterium]